MDKNTYSIIAELAKRMRVMIVDADSARLDAYTTLLESLFVEVYTSQYPRDAYLKWRDNRDRYDIIILSISDSDIGNLELFKQIRKKSYEQKIIFALKDQNYNDLKELFNKGIDGIIASPSDEETLMVIFQRLLRDISDRKLLHSYITQLSIMAKDNADLRIMARNQTAPQPLPSEEPHPSKEPNSEKPASSLIDKYGVRTSFKGNKTAEMIRDIDMFSLEKIDLFRERIHTYHHQLVNLDLADAETTKATILKTIDGLLKIIDVINDLNLFPVTVQAALHMSSFVNEIDSAVFDESEKKNLIIDILVAMFDDLDRWIETVFIQQDLEYVNYFDASFANTCLELESAFISEAPPSDDDALEFF